jgi:hypothetical protein
MKEAIAGDPEQFSSQLLFCADTAYIEVGLLVEVGEDAQRKT